MANRAAIPFNWPEKLASGFCSFQPNLDLEETEIIQHILVSDNGVGPCVLVFDGQEFRAWWPALTVEHAEIFAMKLAHG